MQRRVALSAIYLKKGEGLLLRPHTLMPLKEFSTSNKNALVKLIALGTREQPVKC